MTPRRLILAVVVAHPDQLPMAAEVCQSFALDNGAFSHWKTGERVDIPAYQRWVEEWYRHPGFDWCIIPDAIDGDEAENKELILAWKLPSHCSVPVWHLHESLEYLAWLVETFPRIALGSSGEWSDPGSASSSSSFSPHLPCLFWWAVRGGTN